jgi:hypothetical protein
VRSARKVGPIRSERTLVYRIPREIDFDVWRDIKPNIIQLTRRSLHVDQQDLREVIHAHPLDQPL